MKRIFIVAPALLGLIGICRGQTAPLNGVAIERYLWNQAKNDYDKAGSPLDDPSYFQRGMEAGWDLSKDAIITEIENNLYKGDLLAKGVTLSTQSGKTVYAPNNLNVQASYSSNGVHLSMLTDPAEFPIHSTTPSVGGVGLGSYADPEFTLRFRLQIDCDLAIPSDPRIPVALRNLVVTSNDVHYSGDNLVGTTFQALTSLIEAIIGSSVTDILNKQLSKENGQPGAWSALLDPINAAIASAQAQGYTYVTSAVEPLLNASTGSAVSGNRLVIDIVKSNFVTSGPGKIVGDVIIDPACGEPSYPIHWTFQRTKAKGRLKAPPATAVPAAPPAHFARAHKHTYSSIFRIGMTMRTPMFRSQSSAPALIYPTTGVGEIKFGASQKQGDGIHIPYTISGLPLNTPLIMMMDLSGVPASWSAVVSPMVVGVDPGAWLNPITVTSRGGAIYGQVKDSHGRVVSDQEDGSSSMRFNLPGTTSTAPTRVVAHRFYWHIHPVQRQVIH